MSTFYESNDWESQDDKEGFGNMLQFFRAKGIELKDIRFDLLSAYFIQKNREASEYFIGLVGDQVSYLNDQLHSLQAECRAARQLAEQLSETVKAQNLLLETLTKVNNQESHKEEK